MTKKEKYQQLKKEAKATVAALFAIIVFWAVAGIGVSKLGITVFCTPLWAITGCIGTWLFATFLIWWVIRHVYKDMDLEEEDGDES